MLNENYTIRCPRCGRREVFVDESEAIPVCHCTDCRFRFPYELNCWHNRTDYGTVVTTSPEILLARLDRAGQIDYSGSMTTNKKCHINCSLAKGHIGDHVLYQYKTDIPAISWGSGKWSTPDGRSGSYKGGPK